MPEVYVQRGAGDLDGPDVIDPLMSEVPILVLRGTTLIDRASNLQKVYITSRYRSPSEGVQRGALVEVQDILQGVAYRAKVVGVAYRSRGVKVILELVVLRVSP